MAALAEPQCQAEILLVTGQDGLLDRRIIPREDQPDQPGNGCNSQRAEPEGNPAQHGPVPAKDGRQREHAAFCSATSAAKRAKGPD